VSFFVTDHAGTPAKLIDERGGTLWEAEPDDWGAVQNEEGARQPIRFQGQWVDEESGFYYNRHRYYDPRQGRYITQDPIGFEGGVNFYGYPLNPLQGIDPLGLYNAEKCASIKKRIDNLEEEIWNKRYPDLAKNPNPLPYKAVPGTKLRDTIQGHEILLTIARRNLDNAWKEWRDNGCDNPPPPVPTGCPESSKAKEVAKDVAKVGGAAIGLYIGYKLLRAALVSFIATPVAGAASLALP
jgi:RHS repeat-associated protein